MNNLPLSDRAGRGQLEQQVAAVVRDMQKVGQGRDPHEFERLSHRLDGLRSKFHQLYHVKEHPTEAPIKG
jgi:hypothetical protein